MREKFSAFRILNFKLLNTMSPVAIVIFTKRHTNSMNPSTAKGNIDLFKYRKGDSEDVCQLWLGHRLRLDHYCLHLTLS